MADICTTSPFIALLYKLTIIHRPSILLVANSTWNLFHYRRPWIEGLVYAGYQVLTAAPTDQYCNQLKQLTGTDHLPLTAMDPKGQSGLKEIDCLREIRSLYKRIHPDLVVHFTVKPNIYGGLVARTSGLPYLAVITGLGYPFLHDGWRNRIVPLMYKIALRQARKVVFYNQTDANHFQDNKLVGGHQIRLINGSGVDSDHFATQPLPPLDNDQLRLIYVGRILRDKGIMELLEATRRSLLAGINIKLTILGDLYALNPEVMKGEQFLDLIEAINQESSRIFSNAPNVPRIEFVDAVDDVRPYLKDHHLFVLPSYREGLSRAGVEALCIGRPILTTDVPGCRELVSSEQPNGTLIPAKSTADLENAIAFFSGLTYEALVQMGKRSRNLAEVHFSARATTSAFLEVVKNNQP